MSDSRRGRHELVSASLADYDDAELAALLRSTPSGTAGVGGGSSTLEIGGIPVFVKQIPLTDRELAHPYSTVNLFGLPLSCQYGMHRIGSPGFGAWRELAANLTITEAVLNGEAESFALLHHWRVLPGRPPIAPEHRDIEAVVAQFGGDPAVRDRFEQLAEAGANLALFFEHIPLTLNDWLQASADSSETLEQQLFEAVAFLRSREILHMDGHFGNMRAHADQVYLIDFGLATSPRFDLSEDEREFARNHVGHDADYAAMRLVNWLVDSVRGAPELTRDGFAGRNAYVRLCADGTVPHDVPASVAGIIARHATAAAAMNEFHWQLADGNINATYPGPVTELPPSLESYR